MTRLRFVHGKWKWKRHTQIRHLTILDSNPQSLWFPGRGECFAPHLAFACQRQVSQCFKIQKIKCFQSERVLRTPLVFACQRQVPQVTLQKQCRNQRELSENPKTQQTKDSIYRGKILVRSTLIQFQTSGGPPGQNPRFQHFTWHLPCFQWTGNLLNNYNALGYLVFFMFKLLSS